MGGRDRGAPGPQKTEESSQVTCPAHGELGARLATFARRLPRSFPFLFCCSVTLFVILLFRGSVILLFFCSILLFCHHLLFYCSILLFSYSFVILLFYYSIILFFSVIF